MFENSKERTRSKYLVPWWVPTLVLSATIAFAGDQLATGRTRTVQLHGP